ALWRAPRRGRTPGPSRTLEGDLRQSAAAHLQQAAPPAPEPIVDADWPAVHLDRSLRHQPPSLARRGRKVHVLDELAYPHLVRLGGEAHGLRSVRRPLLEPLLEELRRGLGGAATMKALDQLGRQRLLRLHGMDASLAHSFRSVRVGPAQQVVEA